MKRILVTGAGGSPATNFIRSIRKIKEPIFIVGADADKFYVARSEADVSYLVPLCTDQHYIKFLNYLIEKHQIEFIHAQNDAEMQVISDNREKLKAKVFLPAKETVSCCMSKYETYQKWEKAGIKVPQTFLISNVDELADAYSKLGEKIWLREISGAGGKGSLAPKDFDQAKTWIKFHKGWGKFLAAELLTPDSVTWMSIWKDGNLVVAQGRKRLYWELSKLAPSGVSGATGAGVTISDSQLDALSLKCIKSVDPNPNGIFSVDLTYDFSGVPNPTEINIGRFFTTHEFFTRLGLNMPEVLIRLAYNEEIPKFDKKVNPLEDDWVWIRGMDFLPVLIKKTELDKFGDEFKATLIKLK